MICVYRAAGGGEPKVRDCPGVAASGNRSSSAIFQERAAAADNKVSKEGSQSPFNSNLAKFTRPILSALDFPFSQNLQRLFGDRPLNRDIRKIIKNINFPDLFTRQTCF